MASVKSYPSKVIDSTTTIDEYEIKLSFDEHSSGDPSTGWAGSATFMVGGFNFAEIPSNAVVTDLKITIIAQMVLSSKYITLRAVKNATSISAYTDLGDGAIRFIENSNTKQTVTKSYPVAKSALTLAQLKNDTLQVRFNSTGGGELYEIYATVEYELPSSVITVNAGTGGTVSGGGEYENGTTATLTATPNAGYVFKQWSDGNTSNPRTVMVSANATYTAQFEKLTYSVTVSASPTSGGTVSGGGTYEHGSTATLTATPNAAHNFKQWSDGNTNNPRTVTVTANATYTAVFEKKTFSVTATASPPEGGTVQGSGTYEYSTMATLKAIPNEGYKFTQWSTGVLGNPYSITVFSDTEIVAYFEKEQTSNIFVGTQRVTAYCGTQKMSVYCGTKKMS